jgi:predicted DNA-binding transcriptional regulator YafY
MGRTLSRAARLLEIEGMLFRNAQGLRVPEIARACGVNRRTIYRDIDLLSDAGVPIWQENGCYGIIRDQYLATVRLKFSEAVALYIAARLLSRHADEHNPHIVSALNKLATAFPDPLADYISRTAESIRARPVNREFVSILETITLCWAENHRVRIWYRSPRSGELRQRDLSPYLVEPSAAGGLYVIGYDDWAHDLRTFKLERLERAERLPETYTIPHSFDAAAYLSDAWGIMSGGEPVDIELRFSTRVATYIRERIWHPSQELDEQPNGSLVFRVHVSDMREMRPWIRSWGAEVEVLAPESLRQELMEEATRLADLYHQAG